MNTFPRNSARSRDVKVSWDKLLLASSFLHENKPVPHYKSNHYNSKKKVSFSVCAFREGLLSVQLVLRKSRNILGGQTLKCFTL